jgi:hypothetical protein
MTKIEVRKMYLNHISDMGLGEAPIAGEVLDETVNMITDIVNGHWVFPDEL